MGATNYKYYTDNQIQIAQAFKALGHPARIAILELLCQFDHLNIKDINSFIPISQSNLSRHCKELYLAGIIGQNNVASNTFYKLNTLQIQRMGEYIEQIERKRGDALPAPLLHLFKTFLIKPKIRSYPLT